MCLAPQRRAIFPPFLDLWTSKSGPYPSVFWHFYLKMCFSLQRRAIFAHRNFKKWSEHVARGTFWLKMCFSLQRGAIFPHLNFKKWSAPEVFCTFWLQNVLLATAACNFCTSQLQKVVRTCSERHILIENVLLATAACNFSCLLSTATSAPAALPRLLFDPTHPQIIEKHSISRLP